MLPLRIQSGGLIKAIQFPGHRLYRGGDVLPYNAVMAKAHSKTDKNPAPALYTLTLDKRQAKTVLTILGAVEMRMFEKGFELKPAQLKLVHQLRKQLSEQLGESDSSFEEQLAAALEWAHSRRKKAATSPSAIASSPEDPE